MGTSGITRIAVAGDVMIGRGIDQIMHHPGDPVLHEGWARSALRYVELAEARSGPLPRGVDPAYVWGDSLSRLADAEVDARIINLETALTARGDPWPGKGIHYRAHPENADTLVAAEIDAVTIANNHVLDWSEPGLEDTIQTLADLGVGHTGAGRGLEEAWQPESVPTEPGRVVVLGLGTPTSGIDPGWVAGPGKPGVAPSSIGLSEGGLTKSAKPSIGSGARETSWWSRSTGDRTGDTGCRRPTEGSPGL